MEVVLKGGRTTAMSADLIAHAKASQQCRKAILNGRSSHNLRQMSEVIRLMSRTGGKF